MMQPIQISQEITEETERDFDQGSVFSVTSCKN